MSNVIDLSGTWTLRPDPGNVGLAEGWFESSWRDHPDWRDITVPAAWQHVLGEHFHTVAWYRRRINIPDTWRHTRTRVRFDSVATGLTLWINGHRVGNHVGDYVRCEFDITPHVSAGASLDLVVRIDEMMGHMTKGFHDMLSLHHGGIWQPVSLIGSGTFVANVDGIAIDADPSTGRVQMALEHEPAGPDHRVQIDILAPSGARVAHDEQSATDSCTHLNFELETPVQRWPRALYAARVTLIDSDGATDAHTVRFGFRDLSIDGTTVRLNGQPIHLRGILHWGHEPRHIAPASTEAEIRADFRWARAAGFNCICLCMWYPPRRFFEIADEEGMFVWQEHPVWHSPMDASLIPEYKRLYETFLRRDRNHPCVLIVSATCEHPCFDPELASWWWTRAREMLPRTLLQVQTSSFAWSDPAQTDLYDEHTYDNNNRWVTYLEDLQHTLASMDVAKPFVMGESVVFSSWPDLGDIRNEVGAERPWWLPCIYEHGRELEDAWSSRFGVDAVTRLRTQSDRHHLLGRQFQIERFRSYANHAGLVMNHLRDVPQCTCGFKDDLDRWRFNPAELRGWLSDAIAILATPDHRRSFESGERVAAHLVISNFSARVIATTARINMGTQHLDVPVQCDRGVVSQHPVEIALPTVDAPTRVRVTASGAGFETNAWDLWVFPPTSVSRDMAVRLDSRPFSAVDAEPDEIERGYSRGFGLPVRQFTCRLPDPATLLPQLATIEDDDLGGATAPVIVTHRLTKNTISALERGASVVLFASKAEGGLGTTYEWLFGQCPLVIEHAPLRRGDSDWIVDLLGFDFTRTYARVIPVDEVGLTDHLTPLVRLVYTHDVRDRVRFFDMLSMTRVGAGTLVITSLDLHDAAGQFLLHQVITELAAGSCAPDRTLDVEVLCRFVMP